MTEPSMVQAVALLRVPEWDAPDELDVRFLDDGALVFLDVDFGAEPDDLLDALDDAVGEVGDAHDDPRGVFFLPDSAEPDEATTYDAVIAAVGDEGRWIAAPEGGADLASMLGGDPAAFLGQAFEAMGLGDPQALLRAMQGGDPGAAKLAEIQMQGKLAEMMRAAGLSEPGDAAPERDEPPRPGAPKDDPKR